MEEDGYNSGKFKDGSIPWNKGLRKEIDLDLLKIEYNSGKSTYDCEKIFNVNERTIASRLKEMGILRTREEALKLAGKKISKTMKERGIKPKKQNDKPWNKGKKLHYKIWNKGKIGVQESSKKGKSFEEFYGKEEAIKIRGKIKEKRKYQITPTKDTSIEVKIQNFLKELNIEFFTHQYMKIEHGYQCDILIPSMNLVIECDGDYWHKYPIGRDIDHIRTKELIDKGFRVLRLWEHEIKDLRLEEFREKIGSSI